MHPPFGFALFYLRGVAPKEVKSSDIYLGAIPWVGLQLVMVALVIIWPGLVTGFLDVKQKYDLDKVRIDIPTESYDPQPLYFGEPKPAAPKPLAPKPPAQKPGATEGPAR